MLAALQQRQQGQRDGGLAGGRGDRADAALQRGEAVLEHRDGRVARAAVGEAGGLEPEHRCRRGVIRETERRGLVDGRDDRPVGCGGLVAGVDLLCGMTGHLLSSIGPGGSTGPAVPGGPGPAGGLLRRRRARSLGRSGWVVSPSHAAGRRESSGRPARASYEPPPRHPGPAGASPRRGGPGRTRCDGLAWRGCVRLPGLTQSTPGGSPRCAAPSPGAPRRWRLSPEVRSERRSGSAGRSRGGRSWRWSRWPPSCRPLGGWIRGATTSTEAETLTRTPRSLNAWPWSPAPCSSSR